MVMGVLGCGKIGEDCTFSGGEPASTSLWQRALLAAHSPPMNKLYVGFEKDIALPPGGFLLLDEVREVARSRVFDPARHSFNPLKDMGHLKARELADIFYTVYPQGENTLTVRNGKRSLVKALMGAGRLDKVQGDDEVRGMVEDILFSPVIRQVLCQPTNFSFNPNSKIVARINRAELGDFDALLLGMLLMCEFKGQVIVPELGFYGREQHTALIRQNRLIAGVNFLDELPAKLKSSALLIKEKVASRTTFADAEVLGKYARLSPGTVGFSEFVEKAVA
jgi:hypothetical protein